MKVIALAASFTLLVFNVAHCQIRLPELVSDSMVLQRDRPVKIWGWAADGEKVSITFSGKTYHVTTDTSGRWFIILPAMKAGGPYNMRLTASNQIVLKNILIGDVWLCAGQSNMVLPMERVKEKYADIIATTNNPLIRHFFIPTKYVFNGPQEDLPQAHWETATPAGILRFSATAYFFAKDIFDQYHVPIGLINASVGGTPVEAWISKEGLKTFPQQLATVEKYTNQAFVDSATKAANAANNAWNNRIEKEDKGLTGEKRWYDTSFRASGWQNMKVPGFWNDQGLKGINGVVWFRKEVTVPASMTGKPAKLWLGRIVDKDIVYVNGIYAGATTYQYPPRRYELPANVLKEGKNSVVVRVINSSGMGGFITDKPYYLAAGNDTINLKGEWQYALGASVEPLQGNFIYFQNGPEGLYNAMIAPLIHYSIKGALWYQGESNVGNAKAYEKLLPALIKDWRTKWNQGSFPFVYVQLPNYQQAKLQPSESQWAEMREAQLSALAMPKTAMAVTHDLGEWNDIHPLNKQDVGKRLALAARRIAYGDKKVVYSGPVFQTMKIAGNKIILRFTNTGSGLTAKGGELKQFAIAGTNKKFAWAKARIENNTVIVWHYAVTNPVAVRYAWADNPEGANLYNKEGLPASSFRTDKQ